MGHACWAHLPGFNAILGFLCRGNEQKAWEPLAVKFRVGSRFTYVSQRPLGENPPHGGSGQTVVQRRNLLYREGWGRGMEFLGYRFSLSLAGWMPAAAAPGLKSMCRPRRKNPKSESRRSSLHVCMGCASVTVYISVVERVEKRTPHGD